VLLKIIQTLCSLLCSPDAQSNFLLRSRQLMQLMLTLKRTRCKIISSGLVARGTYQGNHAWNMAQSFFYSTLWTGSMSQLTKKQKAPAMFKCSQKYNLCDYFKNQKSTPASEAVAPHTVKNRLADCIARSGAVWPTLVSKTPFKYSMPLFLFTIPWLYS